MWWIYTPHYGLVEVSTYAVVLSIVVTCAA